MCVRACVKRDLKKRGVGLNFLMSGQGKDFFILREIVIECEEGETHL